MKIKLVIVFAMLLSILACENQEFAVRDFDSTSVYFPYQRPARTLVQGNYDLGFNDNDNNGRFEIGVVMSGVFENKRDRRVFFELAPELIDANLLGVDSVNVQALPSSYYTIEQTSPVTIPAGSVNGRIPIQLEDAFFDDPLAFAEEGETHYVIPLRITDYEELDSLLTGVPIVSNPIKILDDNWNPPPKDYTLFGIKFMNKYQGIYLRRGADVMTNGSGEVTTSEYRAEFVVDDELTELMTTGRSNVSYSNRVRRGELNSPGDVNIELQFNGDDTCIVTSADGDLYNVSGSGQFVEDGDAFGGEPRDVIYLDYSYTDAANNETHAVKDTLVIRNRNVKFEQFVIELTTN
ncbi:DUF5627 domain-containing protein [Seonamhaeicola aphaedonensis]|uniref:Uncharacterized protein DUF1735 n=1 Tax=Seonamhaeicola aphaedonensis TaxID=1461338 RepID=A0A3D9HE81_9FLAO|nr:DUF5627 domain-containing protein [Seonamhaeicola aphaedonensis]RED47779.1 uncharacterized protein DUF1735 [Seonamhaeicola aphaedonensis]